MNWWGRNRPRQSARVLIIEDGKLLTFRRKRRSRKTGEIIEYYSIPGGGIDKEETPEAAAIRELKEEMGIDIVLGPLAAHRLAKNFEHYVYPAHIVSGSPALQLDSEEAASMHDLNQFEVAWVEISSLSEADLRYYKDYLGLIRLLADGKKPGAVLRIDAR